MMEAGSDRGLLVQKPSEKLKIKMCNTRFPQKSRAPRPTPFPLVLSSEETELLKTQWRRDKGHGC